MYATNADMPLGGHDELIRHCVRALRQHGPHHTDTVGGAFVAQAQKDDASVCLATAKDELSKILIVGHDDAGLLCRAGQDDGIRRLRHRFGHGKHVVVQIPQQRRNNRTAGGFIHKESHARRLGGEDGKHIFAGHDLSRVRQCSPYIVGSKPWVFAEDLFLPDTLADHADDQLHRDSSTADHRFTEHDARVQHDAFE
jgi:hypothetical protein